MTSSSRLLDSTKIKLSRCDESKMASDSLMFFFQVSIPSLHSKYQERRTCPIPYPSPGAALREWMAHLPKSDPQPPTHPPTHPHPTNICEQTHNVFSLSPSLQPELHIFLPNLYFKNRERRTWPLPIPLPRGCTRGADGKSPEVGAPADPQKHESKSSAKARTLHSKSPFQIRRQKDLAPPHTPLFAHSKPKSKSQLQARCMFDLSVGSPPEGGGGSGGGDVRVAGGGGGGGAAAAAAFEESPQGATRLLSLQVL